MSTIVNSVAGRKAHSAGLYHFALVSSVVRAFLSVFVERIVWIWTVDVDAPTRVRLKWWGQPNEGNVFQVGSSV